MEARSIDAIVAMVSAGLGVSIVPQPRQALLEAHGVRALGLGGGGPTRQIAVVRRRTDADNGNIDAVAGALAAAYHRGRRRQEALMVSCVRDLLRSPARPDR